jgi:signal transduction histidine kinase
MALVLAGVVAGAFHERTREQVRASGADSWSAEEERIVLAFQDALDPLLERGTEGAVRLAALSPSGNLPTHEQVSRVRREGGFQAAAIFDAEGRLAVWDGDHRGRIPEAVALGTASALYRDLPLAGYLYLTRPTEDGGTAVVAILMNTDLPRGVRRAAGDFLTGVQARLGAEVRLSSPPAEGDPAAGSDSWEVLWEGEPLLLIRVSPVSEARRLQELDRLAALWGTATALLVWLLLSVSPGIRQPGWSAGAILVLSLLLPVEEVAPGSGFASPATFLLLDLPLARWCGVAVALGLAAGLVRPRARLHPLVSAALLSVVFFVAGGRWLRSASPDALAGTDLVWLSLAAPLTVALTLAAWLVLSWTRGDRSGAPAPRVWAGWTTALAVASGGALWAVVTPGLAPWYLALAGLPLLVWGGRGLHTLQRHTPLLWLAAGLIAAGLALPLMWGGRIEARISAAQEQVDRLYVQEDPLLEFLLARLAFSADSLASEGVRPVELLYGSWRNSGLADNSYPIWLTLWTEGGFPREHLPIGMGNAPLPAVAYSLNDPEDGARMQISRPEVSEAHYTVQVPLADGRVVTGIVPPFQKKGEGRLLGPLFGSLEEESGPPLRLVPLLPGEAFMQDSLAWRRAAAGWRGELALDYPDGRYQAFFDVDLPGPGVALARAALIMSLALALAVLLWVTGRSLRGVPWPVVRDALQSLRSFRVRITLALFAFFAASNLIFGALAYRTITGASERAAQVLAERAVNDAATAYLQDAGAIELLARRVGSDLLEYGAVGLVEGSLEPLVELGLYEGWVPYPVYSDLMAREAVIASAPTSLGDWSYVTAYRRLPNGDILGAPVPLETGASAVRSREIVHLVGFAILAGMALSIVLSLMVGRALSYPIHTLRVASERVGSGNLGLRLPADRSDEFGTVYRAFNRMVRRLRRARRTLVRNTRRTQAVVEEAAAGVVALDGEGRVTLANSQARALLQAELLEGSALASAGGAGPEVWDWLGRMLRDGLPEAGMEISSGDRRIRAQARRITRDGSGERGVVLSLEDVTDELRSERILAWGEMARQVAHEVKNPLTPMKLSVQHLRRAWDDQRPDFGEILDRNAQAMLGEIDRLAGIASSFSRFGAPGTSGGPLEPVELGRVVAETMTLYGSSGGPVSFRAEVDPGLPTVQARASEVKEVLLNLLENARAAIDGAGEVLVTARAVNGDVVLRVRDDGSGISPEFLARVFEPHFSTRSAGTGLGLAIVKRVVESWGASVSVESEPGKGSTFEVKFLDQAP